MVGRDGGPPRLVVERALRRLVRRQEFEDEIKRLKLDPDNVVHELVRDPAIVASARETYEPVEYLLDELDGRFDEKPEFWPEQWQPSRQEVIFVIATVFLPLMWITSALSFGTWLPTMFIALSAVVVLVATLISGLWGLPTEFLVWVVWVVHVARLITVIPAHRWVQQRALGNEVLSTRVREWLSAQMTPSFDLELQLRNADGLTLPAGKGPLVTTTAVAACRREVNRSMPGAVGLAGPRGVGKSTIIERAVAGEFTEIEHGPMLGVLASAPVRYDARDFVLHLHARVCRAVLDFLSESRHLTGSETRRLWKRLHSWRIVRRRLVTWTRAAFGSVVLALAALGYAEFTWGWTSEPAVLWQGGASFVEHLWADLLGVALDWHLRLFTAVLAVGFALRAVWIMLFSVILPLPTSLAGTALRLALRSPPSRFGNVGHDALRVVAEQHLHRIRFLQTRTSGWSGKVSAPLGSELGHTRSLARSEQPWTHPEVVDRFRDFMELVVDVLSEGPVRLGGIIIAIDELDKISDPEEAQRFLNEIKGVFGVPHCLFLVSMSDDALTAFERRGIPARDAFDSSFTTMIHVQSFSLDESRTWLAQRALGIPEPFVWLCHCMSGGLPRDLGRVAIALHDLQAEHTRLADVTRELVRQDLDLKIRAFTHAARHSRRTDAANADANQVQELIKELQFALTSSLADLAPISCRIWPNQQIPTTQVEDLRSEAACYLLFCQTVAEVFSDDLDPKRLNAIDGVSTLARTRLHMALDTKLASSLLEDFRSTVPAPTRGPDVGPAKSTLS